MRIKEQIKIRSYLIDCLRCSPCGAMPLEDDLRNSYADRVIRIRSQAGLEPLASGFSALLFPRSRSESDSYAERIAARLVRFYRGPSRPGFKQRIRDITRRAKSVSITTTMEELAQYMRGWRGYFGFCETPEELITLTRLRLRLRAALWRQWKTPRRRRAALIALGVSGELRSMAGSGRGPWHLARSKVLSVGLPNAHFKSLGFLSFIDAR
jgi:hypothetical protein